MTQLEKWQPSTPRERRRYIEAEVDSEWFQEMASDCCRIVAEGQLVLVVSKWKLGTRIVEEHNLWDKEGRNFAPYGSELVQNLAAEIYQETGAPCSRATLYQCIRFARKVTFEELSSVIKQFQSWYNITHNFLPEHCNEDTETTAEPPDFPSPSMGYLRANAEMFQCQLVTKGMARHLWSCFFEDPNEQPEAIGDSFREMRLQADGREYVIWNLFTGGESWLFGYRE